MPTIGIPQACTAVPTLDQIQTYVRAENALNMALFYLRRPSINVAGAARKTVQALDAMNQLKAIGFGSAANDGRRG